MANRALADFNKDFFAPKSVFDSFSREFFSPESSVVNVSDVVRNAEPPRPVNVDYPVAYLNAIPPQDRQATLDIDPEAGLLPFKVKVFGINLDPTAGLLQRNPDFDADEEKAKARSEPSFLEKFQAFQAGQSLSETDVKGEYPNPLIRDKDFRPAVILYGPRAGALTSGLKGMGLPLPVEDMTQVRPEAAKADLLEFGAGIAGEVVKYGLLGRVIGGIGLTTGIYKWGTAGVVSGVGRGLVEGKSASEIAFTPDVYIEASLAGSPFIANAAWKRGASFLHNYIKRPIAEIPGQSFYRDGKITRPGETPPKWGELLDASGKPLEPAEVILPDSPAAKWFNSLKESMPKIQDDVAKFIDNSAAAGSFLAALNHDIANVSRETSNLKDHFFGATQFLWQAKNRGKTVEFKSLMDKIQKAMESEHVYSGGFLEDLREAGITEWTGKLKIPGSDINLKNTGEALAALLERGDPRVKEFRDILNKAHSFAETMGVNVSGYRQNYFPRMMKTDVAKKISEDVDELMKSAEAGQGLESYNLYLQPDEVNRLSKTAEAWAANKSNIDKPLSVALRQIVADPKNKIDNYGDALYFLRQQAFEDLFSPFGNLERPRIIELPDSFYERDALKVLPRYLRGVGKRVATVQAFGGKGEGASGLLKSMNAADPNEAKIAKQILDSWTGRINIEKRFTGKYGNIVQGVLDKTRNLEVATKIGFGLSVIPNTTQMLISSIPIAGVWRGIKGGFEAMVPAARSNMRRSGILLDTAQDAILGFSHDDAWSKFSNISTEVGGFAGINRINQYWSAGIGRQFMNDLYVIANRTGGGIKIKGKVEDIASGLTPLRRIEWARRKLKQFGVDYREPLTSDTESRFMWRFANETQLQHNVLKDPLAANDPRLRWMFLFKKFGLKQAQLTKEHIWEEFYKEKNIFPLLRFGVGGYWGGEFVQFSKDKISEIISGQSYYQDAESDKWQRMIDNFSSVGGFGVVGELVSTLSDNILFDPDFQGKDVGKIADGLYFLGAPVQLQTVADYFGWMTKGKGAELLANLDDPVAYREALAGWMKINGTLSRRLSERVETPGQQQGRLTSKRNRKLEELRELGTQYIKIRDDEPEKAVSLWRLLERRADLWNTAYPDYWIDIDKQLSDEELMKVLDRQEEKKLNRMEPKPLNY